MRESSILKRILLRCSRGTTRLWRNNVGQYRDHAGNWIRYGVKNPGGSDLIGWTQLIIKQEHIGRTVAVFTAVEVKRPGKDVLLVQQRFGDMVSDAGGLFGVAHSADEAEQILKGVDNIGHIE